MSHRPTRPVARPVARSPRLVAVVLAVASATAVQGTLLAPAADAAAARPRISVAASDTSVSSGEQFTLSGRLTRAGAALPGEVSVWTRSGDGWRALTGAVVHTTRDGSYRVRVILSSTGDRELKVVGDPDRAGLRNARAKTHVTVG